MDPRYNSEHAKRWSKMEAPGCSDLLGPSNIIRCTSWTSAANDLSKMHTSRTDDSMIHVNRGSNTIRHRHHTFIDPESLVPMSNEPNTRCLTCGSRKNCLACATACSATSGALFCQVVVVSLLTAHRCSHSQQPGGMFSGQKRWNRDTIEKGAFHTTAAVHGFQNE